MKAQESIVEKIRLQLYALSEPKYRHFQCGLMPTVDPESVLGIRTQIKEFSEVPGWNSGCSVISQMSAA